MSNDIQELDVTIDATGKVKVHVRGAKGDSCLLATKTLEKRLGNDVLSRSFTDEFAHGEQQLDSPVHQHQHTKD